MNVSNTPLLGVVRIEPPVFADVRGFFLETWQHERYKECGLPTFSRRTIFPLLSAERCTGSTFSTHNGVRDSAADVSTCVRRAPRRIGITCYAA